MSTNARPGPILSWVGTYDKPPESSLNVTDTHFPGRATRWLAVVAVGAAALRSARAPRPRRRAAKKPEPLKIEKVPDTDLKRMTLEATAAERIGIQTHTVDGAPDGTTGPAAMTVPYGAVLYDAKGATYVYTNPEPRVFVRHPITVDRIDGPTALLIAGPPLGTQVVTVGGSELAGIEFGVGK